MKSPFWALPLLALFAIVIAGCADAPVDETADKAGEEKTASAATDDTGCAECKDGEACEACAAKTTECTACKDGEKCEACAAETTECTACKDGEKCEACEKAADAK